MPYICRNFMHKLLIICILSGILAQASMRSAWVVYYYASKSEFVQQCVNRDKPDLHCDGKCALLNNMKASEEHLPYLPSALRQLNDIMYDLPEVLFQLSLFYHAEAPTQPKFAYVFPAFKSPVKGIFKPPA
ncbi:MAG: hypothetical protein RIR11_683 [Bacteroidota bacterium]|jgi:hypothetical protein